MTETPNPAFTTFNNHDTESGNDRPDADVIHEGTGIE